VNPNIGGIIIGGGKGTGKSAMARALHRIMPPIGHLYHSISYIYIYIQYRERDDI
jgi:predicted ATPase with chaperone activity